MFGSFKSQYKVMQRGWFLPKELALLSNYQFLYFDMNESSRDM